MARLTANPEPARITYDQAVDLAMTEARERGWSVTPATVSHLPRFQTFSVGLRPDEGVNLGTARVYLDDRTGECGEQQGALRRAIRRGQARRTTVLTHGTTAQRHRRMLGSHHHH